MTAEDLKLLSESPLYRLSLKNKKLLEQGIPTVVPFYGFDRLSRLIPGTIPGDHIMITANSGQGKSKLTRKMAVKDPIKFAKLQGVDIKIFYNSLEESELKVEQSLVAQYMKVKFNKELTFYQTTNYNITAMDEETTNQFTEAVVWVRKEFMPYIDVFQETNPLAVYAKVLAYLMTVGTFYKNGKQVSPFKEGGIDAFNYHTPTTIILVTDTVDALSGYKDPVSKRYVEKYESVRNYSQYFCKTWLCEICGVRSFMISQQEETRLKVSKSIQGKTLADKAKPGFDGLLTCKAMQQHVTLAFGLFSPQSIGLNAYMGYKQLDRLLGDYRSILLLKVREAKMLYPNEIPTIAALGRDHFEELPKPHDHDALNRFYKHTNSF